MSVKGKQIALVVALVVIGGYLLSLPVKGLIKPKDERGTPETTGRPAAAQANINVQYASAQARQQLDAGLAQHIGQLETQLSSAKDPAAVQKELAKAWDDVNQPAPSAFYYEEVAKQENSFAAWLITGEKFNDAVKFSTDTLAQPAYVQHAAQAFEQATKLDPKNLDAKTGLGIAYVNGGASSPMQGISLLLDVVKSDPDNIKANLQLGLFSLQSGQYDKAVERFKTVTRVRPDVESYFYLAESYKQVGQKQLAVEAYEKCKELSGGDAALSKKIDEYINEAKN
ncbi:MAG: tetratricopeptide repeat protein [Mucilaginibacter polytrichastri]|nr:tetratricopeptide repeat protein [Mucilaginibacter polytrichastri]